ncbi:unnamed protein product [Polarella glacialis]|uniref:RING-type domain-containing protein n=1 Tax=Polarella glacialis TaxID=89957 RepID=A0A813KRK6_POLGL|nr:unnamed protein product [Polarella glacialis]
MLPSTPFTGILCSRGSDTPSVLEDDCLGGDSEGSEASERYLPGQASRGNPDDGRSQTGCYSVEIKYAHRPAPADIPEYSDSLASVGVLMKDDMQEPANHVSPGRPEGFSKFHQHQQQQQQEQEQEQQQPQQQQQQLPTLQPQLLGSPHDQSPQSIGAVPEEQGVQQYPKHEQEQRHEHDEKHGQEQKQEEQEKQGQLHEHEEQLQDQGHAGDGPQFSQQNCGQGEPRKKTIRAWSMQSLDTSQARCIDVESGNKPEPVGPASRVCVVCMGEPIATAALPCRHSSMCKLCMADVREKTGKCPICRSQIDVAIEGAFNDDFVDFVSISVGLMIQKAADTLDWAGSKYSQIYASMFLGFLFLLVSILTLVSQLPSLALFFAALAFFVGYLPWFLVTAYCFRQGQTSHNQASWMHCSSEDRRRPCALLFRVLLTPFLFIVAVGFFFLPYMILTWLLRPLAWLLLLSLEAFLKMSLHILFYGYMLLRPVWWCGSFLAQLISKGVCATWNLMMRGLSAGITCFLQSCLHPVLELLTSAGAVLQRCGSHVIGSVATFFWAFGSLLCTPVTMMLARLGNALRYFVVPPFMYAIRTCGDLGERCCLTCEAVLARFGACVGSGLHFATSAVRGAVGGAFAFFYEQALLPCTRPVLACCNSVLRCICWACDSVQLCVVPLAVFFLRWAILAPWSVVRRILGIVMRSVHVCLLVVTLRLEAIFSAASRVAQSVAARLAEVFRGIRHDISNIFKSFGF